MTNEELNTALYQKMFAEQDIYRAWLLTQPPEEILRHAYEYTVREDILMSLECNDLTDAQASALLQSPSPLGDAFHTFEQMETGYMDTVFESLAGRADALLRAEAEQRRILRETPIYRQTESYASGHGEREAYRASLEANVACKEAIEAAISEHYHDNSLSGDAALGVIETYGTERTLYVLANTVRQKEWDGRISRDSKEWARTVPVCADPDERGHDRNIYFVVDRCSPGLTDLFLRQVRREEQSRSVRKDLQKASRVSSQTGQRGKTASKRRGQER